MEQQPPYRLLAPPALADLANQLLALLDGRAVANEAREEELEELIREAETSIYRSAARIERDRGCYRVGAAFEPNKGHRLDDIFLTGVDHLGSIGVALLAETALAHPGESLSGLLRILSATEQGDNVREWGVWGRGTWNRKLYLWETEGFFRTKKGSDPKQKWRGETVTRRQLYLIGEICRCLVVLEPKPSNRGEAYEWIKANGGNPRFSNPPPVPALPKLAMEARR
jgi:hypothetical protein